MISKKAILVLGASAYQLPVMKTARQLGYRVVTSDNVPLNPGHSIADVSYLEDTTDCEAILKIAQAEQIKGIIAAGTDVAMVTASYVAEALEITGVPVNSAKILTNKKEFREFQAKLNLITPQGFHIREKILSDEVNFSEKLWLIKPCRSSGSRGVFIVSNESEFNSRVSDSLRNSLDNTAVLEEFINGSQHTCEGILCSGKVVLSIITDRFTVDPPFTATKGHRVPNRLPTGVQSTIKESIEFVMQHLNIKSGPFDCDLVVAGDHVVILEITPRLGGNSLSKLFKAALNFDLTAYAIHHAFGEDIPIPIQSAPKPNGIAIFGLKNAGKLVWNKNQVEKLQKEAWVEHLSIDYPYGTFVEPFINGRNRVGEALVVGIDREDLDSKMDELEHRLAIRTI